MSYLSDWPGKSGRDGGPEHPAVYHMLDVAAVAERLLQPLALPIERLQAFALLAGLHDLGKIGDEFRKMIRHGAAQTLRHWELTEAWLRNDGKLVAALKADEDAWPHLVAAVAGHHGRPSVKDRSYFSQFRRRAGEDAARDVLRVIDDMLALWPRASLAGLDEGEACRLSWWLSGLVVAADWVGSNPAWFPPMSPTLDLETYLEHARDQAGEAVELSGIAGAALRDSELFDFTLRPMQQAASDIRLRDGPMLAVIEDETGAGKTEAALLLARRMLLDGKGRGLYFALPTMATADAMFARARSVVRKMFDQPTLTLAHGRAALSNQFRDLVTGTVTLSDDATCTPWLMDNRRRALLADVGIGTIDQALLAAMRTRFSTLRLWGLSSKILIVDEAHEIAGDDYMAGLLAELLRVHAALGGSAIVLTATLPLGQRARLMRAFEEGAGRPWQEDADRSYPALSIAGGAARRAFSQVTSARGRVAVQRLPDAGQAVELLTAAAAGGAACVWVRNAVDEAIDAVEALRARGVPASLLHARFTLFDRKRIEAAELGRFGRQGVGRAGRVLVATQVVESSLDLDFDVMVSDLAPAAALVQRAGRLWRHMQERPAEARVVSAPVLHVVSPDPAEVSGSEWLRDVLGKGAWVYSLADQWRTADVLFRTGFIDAPAGLRSLIEAVHADKGPVPDVLETAELIREGEGFAKANLAASNIIGFEEGYRGGGAGADDTSYPTRVGRLTRTLLLVRREGNALVPWAEVVDGNTAEAWLLSEVQADARRLEKIAMPPQDSSDIVALKSGWPDWRQNTVTVCPVCADGFIAQGLRYDSELGLLFEVDG